MDLQWFTLTNLLSIMSVRLRERKNYLDVGLSISESLRFILSNFFESKDAMKRWQRQAKFDDQLREEQTDSTQSHHFISSSVSINGCLFLSPPVARSGCSIHETL